MKIDIFAHILPNKYKEALAETLPSAVYQPYQQMQDAFPTLSDLESRFRIMDKYHNVKFYSYTNSIPLFRDEQLPDNFDTIYSDGGKLAHTIDKQTERHSVVFDNANDLNEQGYTDASKYDLHATKWFTKNNKIGLIFH